jgi:hypothetical protein
MQEAEELQFTHSGQVPCRSRKADRSKESSSTELKEILFLQTKVCKIPSYNYVVRVSFKMRQYNLGASTIDDDAAAHEADDDVDVVDDGIEE